LTGILTIYPQLLAGFPTCILTDGWPVADATSVSRR
jgi:hypothetical protein